ncbi:DUF5060 domain-containing protein [Rhodohalobacter sulfatireducens]|uniref:DUF5060 domain-containing protein n=1 Tax=Rhodohalobacter sulfatireducens TaxID=2911366 RepID=A0ABS9KJ24_9BACT|nr:DUF5060 domain-containing protein [Rhodohalobacter sulfatireducens]MCG2590847.1 DUF5060 domain-containing protein [Rhodohalobacter sulfatireducens]
MNVIKNLSLILILISFFIGSTNCQTSPAGNVSGTLETWNKVTIDFEGPEATESDSNPNPFLDYRLEVEFTGPDGEVYHVPGFFAGDGNGGGTGNIWRVLFSPDAPGIWNYTANFVSGDEIAVNTDQSGESVAFDGATGSFDIEPTDSSAEGFYKWGRLEYVGEHYFKFRDGDYWIKGGADSPENFLAYDGFDNTTRSTQNYDGLESLPALHTYSAHIEDWNPGDPDWGDGEGKGIIGALNYLSSKNVNSIYFLLQNIGGDGKDVFPWVGNPDPSGNPENDNLHYDISKLEQWETVLKYAQEKGIALHAVLNEAEEANKRELDDGELGTERKLFYREMIARFGHHPALQWNISEEYNLKFDLGPERVREFASYIQEVDPYDHPITVHTAGDPVEELAFIYGDPLFSTTSVQLNQRRIDHITEAIRTATAEAGHPIPASMDEFTVDVGDNISWIPVDDADRQRKQKLWPTYMSGGQIEFILEGFLEVDSFKKPEADALWDYTWYARSFMQENLPFHQMQPMDERVSNESTLTVGEGDGVTSEMGAQVFAKPGEIYAVYYPASESTGSVDLTDMSGEVTMQWFNPRTGEFEGEVFTSEGGTEVEPGSVPSDPGEDWVLLIN